MDYQAVSDLYGYTIPDRARLEAEKDIEEACGREIWRYLTRSPGLWDRPGLYFWSSPDQHPGYQLFAGKRDRCEFPFHTWQA